ncbi:SRPBCC family protein [Roseibium alexandrii]|uniref:Polyketide cyclase / dehydrase and lipid transport n=1 Tax=Roseibium alexandrii TaxID=388408 RepID=A0A0M6ZYN5_9HYPH|nr:SRPBCC family protein [Roseibium alexandrii]CTQ67437.1 Polyketide cyclase / dehydrase and lipid transport [Roseibium alexandrii]
MDILSLLVGLVFGGIISWAISYHFFSRSHNERNNEFEVLGRVPYEIDTVWEFVSNPGNFHHFLYDRSDEFEQQTIRPGATFVTHTNHNQSYRNYVVEWDPPHRFAWGHLREKWSYRLDLNERTNGTDVTVTRRFRFLTLQELILFKMFHADFGGDNGLTGLTEDTLARLESALHNFGMTRRSAK